LELSYNVRLHPLFHVDDLRPYPPATLRLSVYVTTREDEDEYDIDHIFVVKIDNVARHRGKYLLFYTHSKDEQIPHVWHRLNEVQHTIALHHFFGLT
jgi:hypothetical protein